MYYYVELKGPPSGARVERGLENTKKMEQRKQILWAEVNLLE